MDLPVCRVRQIVVTVTERRSVLLARERVHLEWQTKALCAFVAQTVQSARGVKQLLREVERLTLFPRSRVASTAPQAPEVFSVVRAGSAPAPGEVAAGSARPGSYEQLRAGFGGR